MIEKDFGPLFSKNEDTVAGAVRALPDRDLGLLLVRGLEFATFSEGATKKSGMLRFYTVGQNGSTIQHDVNVYGITGKVIREVARRQNALNPMRPQLDIRTSDKPGYLDIMRGCANLGGYFAQLEEYPALCEKILSANGRTKEEFDPKSYVPFYGNVSKKNGLIKEAENKTKPRSLIDIFKKKQGGR